MADDRPRPKRPRPPQDDEEAAPEPRPRKKKKKRGGGLVPTSNPFALVGYYCGVFGLIPVLGLLLGPLAITFGGLGLYATQNEEEDVGGTGHALTGIVLGVIVTLVQWWAFLFHRREIWEYVKDRLGF